MSWWILTLGALTCAAIPAFTFLRNLRHFRQPEPASVTGLPAVSVLIPARDEAAAIAGALRSVLEERALPLEVVVLDDGSTDATAEIVEAVAAVDSRVRLATAPPLPAGWCGKQHACSVLARLARHEVLVFMDADVRLEPGGLRRVVRYLERSGAALASGFPRQITRTPLERWLLPLIHFVLLGFLPIWRMRRSTHPAYGAGCGQLMAVKRRPYDEAGGHAGIRASVHDGLALPRALRAAGFATDLFDGTTVARCRMYTTGRAVWAGLAKNAHEGLAASATLVPATLLLAWGQVLPLPLLAAALALGAPAGAVAAAVAASVASLLPRILGSVRFRQPVEGALSHPLGVALLLAIQWQAFVRHRRGVPVAWRSRTYPTGIARAPRHG